MKILSLFRTGQLKVEWAYTAHGSIWRILVSETGRFVGECRDQQEKTTSFFCVDSATGTVVWQDLRLQERWWIGIEAVHDNVLIVHGFTKPDFPVHKGMAAFDIETGAERWHNDDLTYWFGHHGAVYAYRDLFEKRIGYALNLYTGAVERTYDESLEPLHQLRKQASGKPDPEELRFPELTDVGSLESSLGAMIEREVRGKKIAGGIEQIAEGDFVLLSYHSLRPESTIESPLYDNKFVIFDLEKRRTLFSDIIARNARAPVPDSFFVKFPFVYFVKDLATLTAVRLWKS